jgi:hypothetical protein
VRFAPPKTLRKIQFQKVPAMRFNKWQAKSEARSGGNGNP